MQIRLFLLIQLLISFFINKPNNYIFNHAYLIYQNDHFVFNFDKIEHFYLRIEIYLNNRLLNKFENIYIFTFIEFPYSLLEENNEINIRFINYDQQNEFGFLLKMKNQYYIEEKFSFNNLIVDYQKIINFEEKQYLYIKDFNQEIKNTQNYINLYDMGNFSYNNNYIFANNIILRIKTKNVFPYLVYDDGYYFNLVLSKNNTGEFLIFYSFFDNNIGINKLINQNILYLSLDNNEKFLEGEIIIEGIYQSNISLIINVIFDNTYLENYKNKIKISDSSNNFEIQRSYII